MKTTTVIQALIIGLEVVQVFINQCCATRSVLPPFGVDNQTSSRSTQAERVGKIISTSLKLDNELPISVVVAKIVTVLPLDVLSMLHVWTSSPWEPPEALV